MDVTEAFRQEGLAKADLFDFVVGSEPAHDVHRTMKSVNVYLESYGGEEVAAAASPAERKEANNNHLPDAPFEPAFWEKEGVGGGGGGPRWEPATLEAAAAAAAAGCWGQGGGGADDTDGAIYTLTVLNGADGLAAWYRPPDAGCEPRPHHQGPGPLDLDTFLDGIPAAAATDGGGGYAAERRPVAGSPLAAEGEFAFDDSGYADREDAKLSRLVAEIGCGGGGGFDNNNDWKVSDNNERPPAGVDSLLRNALQGKAFLTRYNGAPLVATVKEEKGEEPPPEAGADALYDTPAMDDLFLSQLDTVGCPDDYEKLRRIETEVAESVEQYCGRGGAYRLQQIGGGPDGGGPDGGGLDAAVAAAVAAAAAAAAPAKPSSAAKKYAKRSPPAKPGPAVGGGGGGGGSGGRKERSLHYCNICSKGFKDKYSVNVHIRTHTGEKPFNCSLCGKSFRQKAHLAKHYHTHLAQAKNAAAAAAKPPPPPPHGHSKAAGQPVPR